MVPVLAPLAAAAAVLIPARDAHAGMFLGAELDAANQIDGPKGAQIGSGFMGTLGYRIGLGPIFLQPEAQSGYMSFPVDMGQNPHLWRVVGGARLGLNRMVQPAAFAHLGVGWLGSSLGTNGKAFDAGLQLGFKLIPILRFGAQAAYNVTILDGSTIKWVSYGAHAAIEF
jgi:hypothetical protein